MKPIRLEIYPDDSDAEDFAERLTITFSVPFLKKMLGRMNLVREIQKVDPQVSSIDVHHNHPGSLEIETCKTLIYFGNGDSVEETSEYICKSIEDFVFVIFEDRFYAEFVDARNGYEGHSESMSRKYLEGVLKKALVPPGTPESEGSESGDGESEDGDNTMDSQMTVHLANPDNHGSINWTFSPPPPHIMETEIQVTPSTPQQVGQIPPDIQSFLLETGEVGDPNQ